MAMEMEMERINMADNSQSYLQQIAQMRQERRQRELARWLFVESAAVAVRFLRLAPPLQAEP